VGIFVHWGLYSVTGVGTEPTVSSSPMPASAEGLCPLLVLEVGSGTVANPGIR
jgi:hypothetical protein